MALTARTGFPDRTRVQRRTLTVLFGTQILGGIGVALGIAVSTLLAEQVASADVAGFAQTATVLGAAVVVAPISRLIAARGRRAGLTFGYLLAAAGAVIAVVAGTAGLYPLLLVGMLAFGSGTATNLQARYAAADLATPERRGQALSMVVWATTLGAVAGPNLAEPAGRLSGALGIPALAGGFVVSAVVFLLGGLVILALLRPDPLLVARAAEEEHGGEASPRTRRSLRAALGTIRRSPGASLGLAAVATGHTAMIAVMALTPVHMGQYGATLQVIGLVISGHVAGMYALSPVVGWLSDRFGRIAVILGGQATLLLSLLLAGTAPPHATVAIGGAMFLLGLAWSCGLVAGSTLLTESVPTADRPLVQGAADSIMAFCGAAGSAAGGLVIGLAGYGVLNALAAALPIPVLVLVYRAHRAGRRRAAAAPAASAAAPPR
ncbi:MAG: MFS transporter [Streptosporangiales bacterium]|nr:MFS transporter [Streptosporangiales bacterium]